MVLNSREKRYLERYLAGTMTLNDFKVYFQKGFISDEFYQYILSLEK